MESIKITEIQEAPVSVGQDKKTVAILLVSSLYAPYILLVCYRPCIVLASLVI